MFCFIQIAEFLSYVNQPLAFCLNYLTNKVTIRYQYLLPLFVTCSDLVNENWKDSPRTVLDIYRELMHAGLCIWMFRSVVLLAPHNFSFHQPLLSFVGIELL